MTINLDTPLGTLVTQLSDFVRSWSSTVRSWIDHHQRLSIVLGVGAGLLLLSVILLQPSSSQTRISGQSANGQVSNEGTGSLLSRLLGSSATPSPIADSSTGDDCPFTPKAFPALGLTASIRTCGDGTNIQAKDGRIVIISGVGVDGAPLGSDTPLIDVFTKSAEISISEALYSKFIKPLGLPKNEQCVVSNITKSALPETAQAFILTVSQQFATQAEAAFQADPTVRFCGDYDGLQTKGYFEYHPTESTIHYAFVRTSPMMEWVKADSLAFNE